MKIAIGNDHSAVDYKNQIVKYLEEKGIEVLNVGTDTNSSVDYPDIAKSVCEKVVKKEVDFAIILCGTGIGVNITANKIDGIRAALVNNEMMARLSKEHNDANVLNFGARVMGIELIINCIEAYMNATFEAGRHLTRVNKIMECECR